PTGAGVRSPRGPPSGFALAFPTGRHYHARGSPDCSFPGRDFTMGTSLPGGCCGITRRGFLLGAAAGLAAGAPLAWYAGRNLPGPAGPAHPPPPLKPTASGMPGPFPGRVIEVRHPGSVAADYSVDADAVRQMVDRGLTELTGADARYPDEAWRFFFGP